MQALFHWLELLRDYETKPEFCSLHFSFTCPECNTFNDLTGRRRHHTQCSKEQCKYSNSFLASEYVLEQAEQTRKASLDEQNTLRNTSEVLRLLHYWFSTRTNDASADPEIYYNETMISYIAYLYVHSQGLLHRLDSRKNAPKTTHEHIKDSKEYVHFPEF